MRRKLLSALHQNTQLLTYMQIQPAISLNGELTGPRHLCFKGQNSCKSDVVKLHLFRPKDVANTCSAYSKLTSSLVRY